MTKTRSRGIIALLLCVCMLFVFTTSAAAAGEGYSDAIRTYRLTGIDGKANMGADVVLYGKTSNKPVDNYAVVYKYNTTTNAMRMDVIDGAALDEIVKTCISVTQTDMASMNEYLLSLGIPDEWLMLDNKPAVVTEFEKAIKAKETTVKIRDNVAVMPDALKFAASKGITKIHFDTLWNNSVDVRISINPAYAAKGFAVEAYTYNDLDSPVLQRMAKFYTNKFTVIDFYQIGSFGTTVQIAAKAPLGGLGKDKLVFYRFNYLDNTIKQIENLAYTIDDSGYLHFDLTSGGTILITDKALVKK